MLRNKTSFTLIELLIVLAMVSIIGLAIFTTLSNGIRIWQRLNQSVAQEDVNIFFERIAGELRNTFQFSIVNLHGEIDQITFNTFVVTPGSSLPQETGIGQVVYRFDKSNKQIIRERRNYSQIYKGSGGSRQELLSGIDSLSFNYYFYDQQAREYVWLEEWQEDNLPEAVRIELEFDDGQQSRSIIRSITLPTA